MSHQTILEPAKLVWKHDTPLSTSFDDFYFSSDDGLTESDYVFLQPNNLSSKLTHCELTLPLIVAETGFGTGLNFLLTWAHWRALSLPKKPLHFFSIEKFPLTKADLNQSLTKWPQLKEPADLLLEQYPSLVPGLHTLEFEAGKVRLSLLFGDVNTDLDSVDFKADIWYLDGFSPKKNPEMWTPKLFSCVRQKSKQGTSFATFTAASFIRKSLQQHGFTVLKRTGFGKKREMLHGYLENNDGTDEKRDDFSPRWSYPAPESRNSNDSEDTQYDVAIIGAGLAGLSSAYELSRQGLKVALIDKSASSMTGASGQSQLAMYAKLPSEANKLFYFIIPALSTSVRFYNELQKQFPSAFWHPTGLLQLAWNTKEQDKQKRFLDNIVLPPDVIRFIDAQEGSAKTGLPLTSNGLWFEKAGWLSPRLYAQAVLSASKIETLFDREVLDFNFLSEKNHWKLHFSNHESLNAQHLVIATANETLGFKSLSHLPIKPLRGQVTSIKSTELAATKTVVCGEGYLCPPVQHQHHFGATFDLKTTQAVIKHKDRLDNIETIQSWLPGWIDPIKKQLETMEIEDSAGLRCTTPDYLPIVGRAPIAEKFIEDFAKLRVDSNACKDKYGHYYPNLFVNLGHGSKGLFTTPLAAQLIRYEICGGLPPCTNEHRLMLSPARFLIKHLTQRRI